jgi:hypothetical protein
MLWWDFCLIAGNREIMGLSATNSGWVEKLARTGLSAKGLVYVLIGVLAFMAAFEIGGHSNEEADRNGALVFLRESPGGTVLLLLLMIGLICYSTWRTLEGFSLSTYHKKNWAKKLRYWASAVTYLSVAFAAYKVLNYEQGNGGQQWSQQIFHKDYGKILIGIIAVLIAGNGIYQIWYGLSSKFKDHVSTGDLGNPHASFILKSGKIGYTARGIVWLIISFLLLRAVWHARASEAGDTSDAFSFVETTAYGSVLLGALGFGLVAYGIFNVIRAFFEKF